ncbi:MAG: DUF2232 domain-containing protein [Clostridium sp.]|nr:DUF2232 domain-containing protein [Clostridium sp.]
MKSRKLTEAAMLSALFVVISIIAIGTGIAYSLYLDMVVPILLALIYFKCDLKYTILSAGTSLIIVMLIYGNVASGLYMIQSMLMGIVCGVLIKKDTTILDDLFYCGLFGCIVMILIDIYFSGILGYSFIKEAEGYLEYIPYNEEMKKVVFYISVAAIPLGTIFITYFVSLILGKKLKILDKVGMKKFTLIKNFRKFGNLICCSNKTTNIGIGYLLIIAILRMAGVLEFHKYFEILFTSMEYTVLYFLISDSFKFVPKDIYKRTKSRLAFFVSEVIILFLLVNQFRITTSILILYSYIVNKKYDIRNTQIKMINNNIIKYI